MAVTSIHPIRSTEELAIQYIVNEAKTQKRSLVSSFSCSDEPNEAAKMFRDIRETFNSRPVR